MWDAHLPRTVGPVTVTEFKVDAKGRLLLPAAVRAAAGLVPGSRVRGRVEHGRIVVEVPETVQERIWARARRSRTPTAEDRAATAAAEHAALVARERDADVDGVDAVGEQLLTDLGL